MNSLPIEVLHNIFIRLSYNDRMLCTFVCRHWRYCLIKYSLYHSVGFNSEKVFDKFLRMLQRLPSRASQVESLSLEISHIYDKRLLLNIFPNLRIFHFRNKSNSKPSENHWSKSFELINPHSKLERINDDGECELTRQLLTFSSCTRLKKLYLVLTAIGDPKEEIFLRLNRAPALTSLSLETCKMRIEDLEIIHNNLPVLKTLNLIRITVKPSELPSDIIPASSVTRLYLYMRVVEDNPVYLDWYTYLANKYPNLTYFKYLDKNIADFNSIKRMTIYREGVYPIYRNNELPVQELAIAGIPPGLNPFAILDEFGVQVSKFILKNNGTRPTFHQLAESNQSNYVKSLVLQNTAITSPVKPQSFTSLRELCIEANPRYYECNVNLCDYFNAFPPTLTTFTAHFLDAKIDALPSFSNNVQDLDLKCNILYAKLGDAISHAFPKLNSLNLNGAVTNSLNVYLPNNHFKNMCINVHFDEDYPHGFSIMHSSLSQPVYYIKRDLDTDLELATFEVLQDEIIISVHYATTDYLRCDNLKMGSRKK